jgi:ferric-dicitrate binding protein FerR (iron transport regulator)
VQESAFGIERGTSKAVPLPRIWAMSEFAAEPVKSRITPAAQARWLEEAKERLLAGHSLEVVDGLLREAGCPPRLRQELLARADARSRGPHRAKGLRVFLAGGGVLALGAVLIWWARMTWMDAMTHRLGHNDRLAFCGMVIAVVGAWVGLVGIWKMLSGSSVDITAEME